MENTRYVTNAAEGVELLQFRERMKCRAASNKRSAGKNKPGLLIEGINDANNNRIKDAIQAARCRILDLLMLGFCPIQVEVIEDALIDLEIKRLAELETNTSPRTGLSKTS